MPGIIDDANFIFKKTLNIVDKTTGLPVTQFVYEDTKSGKKVKTKKINNCLMYLVWISFTI